MPASHGYTPAANIVTPAMKSLGTFDGGAGTIDVNGALSIGGGSFTATSGTTFVSNNLTISGGTFAHNSGTFSLEPNNKTVNTGAAIFNHVIVNMFNGETLTVTGTMDVNGNLSILGVAAINGTLAVSGNVTTTTFVSGSGIILLDGNTNQTLGASGGVGGIPGLTINNTGAPGAVVTIQDTIDVGGGGAWTYTAGNVNASASTIRFREFSKTISPGSMIFNNVEFNVGSGSTLTISGTLDIDGSLTLTEQSAVNGGVIAVAGNLISTDTTVGGTTAITLDGTGAQSIDTTGGGDLPNGTLMINKAAGTATLAANLTLNGAGQDLTITAGTLDLAGYNPTLTGAGDVLTVDAAGILQLQGGETVTATTKTFNAGSTVIYNGGATYGSLAAGEIYSNLSFNNAAGSWTHTGALDVNGNLTITAGTLLSGGQDVNVAGNWSNSGSYTSGANTVTLDGIGQTVSGDTIFYNLTKSVASADTLTFQAGQTQTLAAGGALSFTGTSGNLLQLRSSSPGTEWFLNVNAGVSPIANYVDVRDSNAAGGQTIYAYYSTDAAPGGTNPNWVFGQQLQLVKQVWDAAGTTCLASIPSDAACNGGATLTNVPAGSAVQFLIFVRNVMAVDAADVRFQDLLDDGAFTFQAGTLKRTPPVIGAPSDVATAAAIFAAANTAQTDAFDGDVSTDEFAGVDTSVSPDNLLIGGNGGVGQNDTLTIPAHKSFGLRFGAVKN